MAISAERLVGGSGPVRGSVAAARSEIIFVWLRPARRAVRCCVEQRGAVLCRAELVGAARPGIFDVRRRRRSVPSSPGPSLDVVG